VERAEASGEKVPGGQTPGAHDTTMASVAIAVAIAIELQPIRRLGHQRVTVEVQRPAASIQRPACTHTWDLSARDRTRPNRVSAAVAAAAFPKAWEELWLSTHFMNAHPPTLPMLSRRLFRQLTDSALLGPGVAPAVSFCIAAKCAACCPAQPKPTLVRHSSSSTRWKSRQGSDHFAKEARVQGLKSRAAFKLLEVPRPA
jgi:hypothetical protein